MNDLIENISFLLVTYKSEHIIKECLEKIPKQSKIIIIENSNNLNLATDLKENKNLKVFLNRNKGYGQAVNVGLTKVVTNFVFLISPDVLLGNNTLKSINNAIKILKNDFTIIVPRSSQTDSEKDLIQEGNISSGHAMLINMNKIQNRKLFDENFFLFYDDIDLSIEIKKKDGKIYTVDNCDVSHYGKNSTQYSFNVEVLRNYHYYWSHFYFHKKHDGIIPAYIKSSKKFFGSLSQYFFAIVLFKKKKKYMNKYKLLGLIDSFLGKPASLRLEDLTGNF
jgi:N-acetylglucosaminyl-diphospho-decaprenol L-rhamnosyltransferase